MSGEPPSGGSITGTLKWLAAGDIADYWGAGNFVALAFEPGDEGATVSVGLDPSQGSGLVPLDEDLNGVFKVTDKDAQVFVVETTKDGETLRQEFDLSGLTLEPEPTPALVAEPSAVTLTEGWGDMATLCALKLDGETWWPDAEPVVTFDGNTCPVEWVSADEWAAYWPADPEQLVWQIGRNSTDMPDTLLVVAGAADAPPVAGTYTVAIGDGAGLYTPATVTITVASTPTGFTVTPNPLTVAVGESVTLHGFVDGVEIDNGDLAFDGDFDIADETIADHGSLNDPTIVRGKTAGATSVTVTYLQYPAVTVPVAVTTPTVTVDPSGR